MSDKRNLRALFAASLFLLLISASWAQPTTSGKKAPAADAAPAPEPTAKPRVTEIPAPPSPAALALLKEIETRHAHLKTLLAEFDQKKTSVAFDDTIKSRGKVYLQMPDKLRCDYSNPDPSTLLFVDGASYQIAPKIKQVDKVVYQSKAQAQAQFRMMLLGFGMSTGEILDSYSVRVIEEKSGDGKSERVLAFKPLDPEVSDVYKEFRVWLTDELMPRKVRYQEVSGDDTELTITKIIKDDPIKEKIFKPEFPKDYEIIEH